MNLWAKNQLSRYVNLGVKFIYLRLTLPARNRNARAAPGEARAAA